MGDVDSCSICLENVADNLVRTWVKLQCGHQFHLDCIGSAFNAKGIMQCPNCRKIEIGQWRLCSNHPIGAQAQPGLSWGWTEPQPGFPSSWEEAVQAQAERAQAQPGLPWGWNEPQTGLPSSWGEAVREQAERVEAQSNLPSNWDEAVQARTERAQAQAQPDLSRGWGHALPRNWGEAQPDLPRSWSQALPRSWGQAQPDLLDEDQEVWSGYGEGQPYLAELDAIFAALVRGSRFTQSGWE